MGIVSDQCRICSTKSASSNPITQSNSSPDVQHAWKRLYSYFLRHICSTAYLFKPPSSSRLSNSAQSTSSRSEQEKHSSNSLTEYSGEAQEGEGAMASPGKKSSKLALIHWNEGDGYEILVAKFPHLNLRDYNNSNNNYDNNSFNNNSSLHGNSARHVNDTTQEGVKGNSTAGRGRPVEKSRSCNSSRNNTPRSRNVTPRSCNARYSMVGGAGAGGGPGVVAASTSTGAGAGKITPSTTMHNSVSMSTVNTSVSISTSTNYSIMTVNNSRSPTAATGLSQKYQADFPMFQSLAALRLGDGSNCSDRISDSNGLNGIAATAAAEIGGESSAVVTPAAAAGGASAASVALTPSSSRRGSRRREQNLEPAV